jgi:phytoene synthase
MAPELPRRGAARYMKLAERHCADMARREAKNFYWGFLALPREKRMAIYALYDFARQVDDQADPAHGSPAAGAATPPHPDPPLRGGREGAADAEAGLVWQRERLRACLRGERRDPIMVVLGQAIERYQIPGAELEALIDGVELDLRQRRYRTWAELQRYCHLVAGVVGQMCVRIFGYEQEAALGLADQLGQAMQLTNILRDVVEDARMGRIYLPLEEMEEFGVTEEGLMGGRPEPGWEAFVRFQAARAHALFASGLQLCGMIPGSASVCVRTMSGIYRRILEEIEADPRRPLRERVSLSNGAKLKVALESWLQTV